MKGVNPNWRERGEGPAVLCLHSSTGSSRQWDLLTENLSADHRVVASDLFGYGKSPGWPENEVMTLDHELELLGPVLESIGGSFHVVGHSFGAAVAFRLCQREPERIRSLTVYEPVLFNVPFQIDDLEVQTEAWVLQDDIHWLLVDGRFSEAAERFIDYWAGEGSWSKIPDRQKQAIEKRISKVRADFDATMGHTEPLEAYRRLKMPILFLYGLKSPMATRKIAEWLTLELPNAEVRGFLTLGHMGPVSHASALNEIIVKFIRSQPKGILPHQVKSR